LIPELHSAKGTQSSGGKKKKEEEENRLNSKSWAKNHWCRDDCHEDDWECCDYECKPKCKITNDVCETDEDFTLTTTSTPPVTSHLTSLAILLPQEYRIVVDGQAGCSFDVKWVDTNVPSVETTLFTGLQSLWTDGTPMTY
jgi:hypothetical protein